MTDVQAAPSLAYDMSALAHLGYSQCLPLSQDRQNPTPS